MRSGLHRPLVLEVAVRRAEVEQRLLRRHPQLPAGVVVAAVGRTARRLIRGQAGRRDGFWTEVELAADELLLLRQALRAASDPPT